MEHDRKEDMVLASKRELRERRKVGENGKSEGRAWEMKQTHPYDPNEHVDDTTLFVATLLNWRFAEKAQVAEKMH